MHLCPNKPKFFQRLAAYAVLAGMAFQLGACPCGCVEHNAWVLLAGIGTDDHNHIPVTDSSGSREFAVESQLVIACDAGHDHCAGGLQDYYLDNSQSRRSWGTGDQRANGFGDAAVSATHWSGDLALDCGGDRFVLSTFGTTQSRPALQVYRL